jgi:3-isopropylmalate dehydrogenase
MKARITVLPGDGVGPEVTREAVRALKSIGSLFGHDFELLTFPIGGAALDAHGVPLPIETLTACHESDAVLLGAVGAPRYDSLPPRLRPETGLLELRKRLGLFANLRPVVAHETASASSPLKPEVVRGTDLLIVRELAGGLYFGEPRGIAGNRAYNTLEYTAAEVERVARVAFDLARKRRAKLTSVDKANVLETSRLWRETVTWVGRDYPDVALEHLYVDSAAVALVTRPTAFDVVVTENLFGDILSDEAGALAGSLGMLPSASLGSRVGLFEPVHGSGPDIAGKGVANPVGALLSAALLLRHALSLPVEAQALEDAVDATLDYGFATRDLGNAPFLVGTERFGAEVRVRLLSLAGAGRIVSVPVITPDEVRAG